MMRRGVVMPSMATLLACFLATSSSVHVVSGGFLLRPEENEPLQAAILKDFFAAIPVSSKCMEQAAASNPRTKLEMEFTTPVPSYFDESHLIHEKHNFLLQMTNVVDGDGEGESNNKNQTFTFRVGRGGNIYSYIGAYGEAMPPQHHHDAPWNDEVWQTVTVDTTVPRKDADGNKSPFIYDIHQAGAYLRDGVKDRPFYAPTLAVHCENDPGSISQCMVVAHGTHAHIASKHSNSLLYFTRYANCGEGVLEVSSLIYNTKYKSLHPEQEDENTVNHLVVPWGGVRKSTLSDMIMTEPGDEGEDGEDKWKVLKPLPAFAWASSSKQIRETAGYTIMTQGVKNPDLEDFQMPEGDIDVTDDEAEAVEEDEDEEEEIEGEEEDDDGDDDDAAEVRAARRRRQRQRQRQRERQRAQQLTRGDEDDGTCTAPSAAPSSATASNSTAPSSAPAPVRTRKQPMALVVQQDNPIRALERAHGTVYRMAIQPTAIVNVGHQSSQLVFRNERTDEEFIVDAVDRWSGAGGDTVLFKCSGKTHDELNGMLQKDDVLVVSHVNEGERREDNLALSHVHGQCQTADKPKFQFANPKEANRFQAFARYGSGGGSHRDFVVLSIIHKDAVSPGELWMKRQYYITDSLLAIGAKSRNFNQDVFIDWMSEEDVVAGEAGEENQLVPSTKLYLYANEDKSVVGVAVGERGAGDGDDASCPNNSAAELVCTGATTPTEENGSHMLYAISCGEGDDARYYVGPKLYAFAGSEEVSDENPDGLARLHECQGFPKDVFPDYKFLGFFNQDNCEGISEADYDPYFCNGGAGDKEDRDEL